MKNEQDHFGVLRKIQRKPGSSQRKLAEELGFSLGKLNYCLKSLQKKGFVKLQNFQNPEFLYRDFNSTFTKKQMYTFFSEHLTLT